MMLDVETLVYLAGVLEKPMPCFLPDRLLLPREGELPNWRRQCPEKLHKLNPVIGVACQSAWTCWRSPGSMRNKSSDNASIDGSRKADSMVRSRLHLVYPTY